MLTTILLALSALLPSILGQFGVNSNIDKLVEAVIQAIGSIFTAIKTGTSTEGEILSVLTILQTTLAAVEKDTSVDPQIVDDSAEAIRDLQAAIAAYEQAMLVEDVSTLTPLPEVE